MIINDIGIHFDGSGSGGGSCDTKFPAQIISGVDGATQVGSSGIVQYTVASPGDWTVTGNVDGISAVTGTGNTYSIKSVYPENTGSTERVITFTAQNQYGSTSFSFIQYEPLDLVATFVMESGSQRVCNSTNWFDYYTVDGDENQYTSSTYNFAEAGTYVIRYRLRTLNLSSYSLFYNNLPTELVIPKIGPIGSGSTAFKNNPNLTTLTVDAEGIGGNSFSNCTSLTSVTFGSHVKTIDNIAFYGCSALTDVTIPSTVNSFSTNFAPAVTGLTLGSGLTIDGTMSTNIQSVVVGNDCKFNVERAFQSCTGLTSLTLGTGCTFTGTHNFTSCSSLPELTLPEGTVLGTTAGQQAYGCTSITALTVNCNVPEQAFRNSVFASNAEVTIGTGCTNIGASAFTNDTGIKTLTFNTGGTWCIADKYAFANCTGLITADLGNRCDINSKSANAFRGCTSLTAITGLPTNHPESDNTVRLRGSAFLNDYVLETINGAGGNGTLVIPEGITLIGTRTLEKVGISASTVITTIDLPSTLNDIANNAISGTQVTAIICRATTAPSITNGTTFAGLSASGTLYIPADADYSTWLAALGEGWSTSPIPT